MVNAVSHASTQAEWRSACPVACGLDVLGDKWSLLLIRDLLTHGTRTYSDFRDSPEGIATNILAARLKLLTSLDLIERVDPDRPARGNAFKLTERGAALRPTINELLRWSQNHLADLSPGMHLEEREF
jgi:DNA-binding HxlR family transcriptional regulator